MKSRWARTALTSGGTKKGSFVVAVADRADRDRTGKQTMTLEREQHLGELVGKLRADQATANADSGEVRLVGHALGQLEAAAQ